MKKLLIVLVLGFSLNSNSQGTLPVLLNFSVENSNKYRIYFESSSDISGLVTFGFTITNKTINSIFINGAKLAGHYFTVNTAFNYWDNNTIRLEGGNGIIHDFTLQYINNRIIEPSSSIDRYVTVKGSGIHNGTLGNEWTLVEAGLNAVAGQTIWIKAGDYGNENVVIKSSGKIDNPIKFIGYENKPNDSPYLTKTTKTVFSSSKMPYLRASSQKGTGINISKKSYVIVRNIQVEQFEYGFYIVGSSNTILDNIYVRGSHGNIYGLSTGSSAGEHQRIINSYSSNATGWAIVTSGERHLIENNHVSSNKDVGMDYHISTNGCAMLNSGQHIIRGNYVERFLGDSHVGHGITFYGSTHNPSYLNKYSLAENNEIYNVRMSLESRRDGSRNNVWRNIHIEQLGNDPVYGILTQGAHITSGHNNIYENITVENAQTGIVFVGATSDDGATTKGIGNIIKNSVFNNLSRGIFVEGDDRNENRTIVDNLIINCTFNNVKKMFYTSGKETGATGNVIKNSVINNVPTYDGKSGSPKNWSFQYSDFWDFWGTNAVPQTGTGNISNNPKFENASKGNFRLKPDSPLIDKGIDVKSVKIDFDGNSRPQGSSHDIGAFEYQDSSTSSIKAAAGEDQTICQGESVNLIASGGSTYKWNTGPQQKVSQ